MNTVFIVPTGVGAEIGGHSGDATPAARLIGSVSDRIILHPNVVNASDINEMPPNAFYVDGLALDKFLSNEIGLKEVKSNKILVAVNRHKNLAHTINAVSAARATLGIDAEIVVLEERLVLESRYDESGCATGKVSGTDALIRQVRGMNFDALAIATEIKTPVEDANTYLNIGGVNPWGGVEAMACRPISEALRKPVAHGPIDSDIFAKVKMIVDPRMSAELVSIAYLFCVLKGLHTAPQWTTGWDNALWRKDIDVLVSPDMLFGPPHLACVSAGIPILVVEENKTMLPLADGPCIKVANYHEAAGYIACKRAGIHPDSVRRPLPATKIDWGQQ